MRPIARLGPCSISVKISGNGGVPIPVRVPQQADGNVFCRHVASCAGFGEWARASVRGKDGFLSFIPARGFAMLHQFCSSQVTSRGRRNAC
jgi:hypothetical protein